MNIFDSSALLAYLKRERGHDLVSAQLDVGGLCSAANWSEVAQKVMSTGADWGLARGLLLSHDVRIEPVTVDDAECAARNWAPGSGLSLADRLCLALAERRGGSVWTADSAWAGIRGVELIR